MDMITTADKGSAYTGVPSVSEIGFIVYITNIIRKYTFAALENCRNRFLKIKLINVYLVVVILLPLYGLCILSVLLASF